MTLRLTVLSGGLPSGGLPPCNPTGTMHTPLQDSSVPGGGGGSGRDFYVGDPFAAHVWTNENLVSSFGKTKIIALAGLPPGVRELDGTWARVSGLTKLDGNFLRPPFAESKGTDLLTHDGFDQVQCYFAITTLMAHLVSLGFDMEKVLGKLRPVIAHVNAVDDLNAWFNPAKGDLTFGTARQSRFGEWHLASDHDIVRHESGHLILHALNAALTSWYARDGGAIHEGFGDGMAAFFRDDPEISEDFLPNIGKEYGTDKGLRTVNNDLLYDKVDSEVHSLGRVYGAFWWGVRQALEPIMGQGGRVAADLTMGFLVNHAAHYTTNRPGPADFVEAAVAGARAFLQGDVGKKYNVTHQKVAVVMREQALRRNMIQAATSIASYKLPLSMGMLRRLMRRDPANSFAFLPVSSTAGTFGGSIFHQQVLAIENRHLVRMLGSGLTVFTDASGEPRAYSDRDMRSDVRVNPAINVKRADALERVKREALRLLEESRSALDGIDRQPPMSEEDEKTRNERIYGLEIERRAREIAYDAVMNLDHHLAEPVIMPVGYHGADAVEEDLYWEIKVPFSEFLVNARTGEIAVKRMPMW